MIARISLACVVLFALVLATFSMGAREQRADFTYVNPSDIHTLDPARMSWIQDFRVALNIWEGLTRWDARTLEPVAGAAEFPPGISEDHRTYTFAIRPDARWSNGEPVTAADFVRGWRRAIEPGTAADYAFLLTGNIEGAHDYVHWRYQAVARLKQVGAEAEFDAHAAALDERFARVGLRALDDRTLEVRLHAPCPYFLDLTAMPAFLPIHSSIEALRTRHRSAPLDRNGLVAYDPQWTKPDYHREGYPGLITNGAYRLVDWTFKRRARLEANPHHSVAASLNCRTIDMVCFDNLNAALMAYESKHVDFLPDLGVSYDHELARLSLSGSRPDFHLCPVMATYFLNFNCSSLELGGVANPMIDRRVRKALTLATDRVRIVENVRGRCDRVAYSFVPAGALKDYQPPKGLTWNPSEARQLLAEAGFPEGAGLPPIEILYTQNDRHVIQAIARMWETELGVRTNLHCKESKTFGEDKSEHRYMVARGKWYADYNDATTFLDCLITGNGNNDSGYTNVAYDALLHRAARTADRQARAALLAEAEAVIVEQDCPILPILHFTEPVAIQPYVSGLYPNGRLWFSFRDVNVQR